MKPISSTLRSNIVTLLLDSTLTYGQIATKLGCTKAIVGKVARKEVPNRENHCGGRPKKLTAADERRIVSQINTGRAQNAVEVTKNINGILVEPVCSQTICNTLKKHNIKAYVMLRRKSPSFHLNIGRLAYSLLKSTKTGQWMIGSKLLSTRQLSHDLIKIRSTQSGPIEVHMHVWI